VIEALRAQPYEGYTYAYPHKTAFRALAPPRRLDELWAAEDRTALFLYVHVPVCEMRCGFCNLFTATGLDAAFEGRYLDALERQSARVHQAVGAATFGAAAIGGGTPTFLSPRGLERLLEIFAAFGVAPAGVPTSVETSPRTAEPGKLELLRAAGVRRISIGVQSFEEAESGTLGRAQKTAWVCAALERIRAAGFPVLNIDLMYGMAGQGEASFVRSIDRALEFRPEELYLYPLYVRPLTGIARRGLHPGADLRTSLYRAGRARLLGAGYEQISMRFFRRGGAPAMADTCCQEDGTVGLGCGARSYTTAVHYSSAFAVSSDGVREILDEYVKAPDEAFDAASHGAELSSDDQRRRFILKTLLRRDGVPLGDYAARFGAAADEDLPQLSRLVEAGLAERREGRLVLTEQGIELSDAIGPRLYAPEARARMSGFELR
jgi:oxygen-independent coproporphyrinogen-3 oxidase